MRDDAPTTTTPTSPHVAAVADELEWLARTIEARLEHFFAGSGEPFRPLPPPPVSDDSALGDLVRRGTLDPLARLTLALALAPHVAPQLLDPLLVRNTALDRGFSEFGGVRRDVGFQPTADTALFLAAGTDPVPRVAAMALFRPEHPLRRLAGLTVEPGGTLHSGALRLPWHRVVSLCEGIAPLPDLSADFPARRLTTPLDWSDLVLPPDILHAVEHILAWLENERRILVDWGLERTLGRGFRTLFHGPPGTGKSLTAALLGKRACLDVFRVDLSMVVSKYIGETEKNLANVFDQAAERDWILFFDEADALFGARTSTSSAHDRYANQEVAYLLQRIEECPSLVILATNLRNNIDDAFFRRFHASIGFTRPDARLRETLWRGMLGANVPLAGDVDPAAMARDHDLAGGGMVNVIRHAAVTALRRGQDRISAADLREAVGVELRKEGRIG